LILLINQRLVFDRDTGKPKGYGFCEYLDAETASSAVRNLNGYDVNGRQLRVDFADNDSTSTPAISFNQEMPLHAPVQNNPNILATDAITELLASYSTPELLEVLRAMKTRLQSNPAEVRRQLADNPQLGYAIFQSLLVTNLVQPNAIQVIFLTKSNVSNYYKHHLLQHHQLHRLRRMQLFQAWIWNNKRRLFIKF
jgi:cleavage stimulation factor subunit 2